MAAPLGLSVRRRFVPGYWASTLALSLLNAQNFDDSAVAIGFRLSLQAHSSLIGRPISCGTLGTLMAAPLGLSVRRRFVPGYWASTLIRLKFCLVLAVGIVSGMESNLGV